MEEFVNVFFENLLDHRLYVRVDMPFFLESCVSILILGTENWC